MKKTSGFSLIEVLVVLTIFGFVALITSGSVLTTIRGAKRADSDTKVRENVTYALSTMERHLRNAVTVSCSGGRVDYTDQSQLAASFYLNTVGNDRYIASVSASNRLTSADVNVTTLAFACIPADGSTPPSVNISITAEDRNAQGAERSQITSSTKVNLRTLTY